MEEICLAWKLRKRWIRQPLSGIGLRVCDLAVCVELRLQGFLVLLAIWPVARALGPEGYGRAGGTAGFDGDVRKPFGNAYRRFLHGTWVSTSTESIPSVEGYSAEHQSASHGRSAGAYRKQGPRLTRSPRENRTAQIWRMVSKVRKGVHECGCRTNPSWKVATLEFETSFSRRAIAR